MYREKRVNHQEEELLLSISLSLFATSQQIKLTLAPASSFPGPLYSHANHCLIHKIITLLPHLPGKRRRKRENSLFAFSSSLCYTQFHLCLHEVKPSVICFARCYYSVHSAPIDTRTQRHTETQTHRHTHTHTSGNCQLGKVERKSVNFSSSILPRKRASNFRYLAKWLK